MSASLLSARRLDGCPTVHLSPLQRRVPGGQFDVRRPSGLSALSKRRRSAGHQWCSAGAARLSANAGRPATVPCSNYSGASASTAARATGSPAQPPSPGQCAGSGASRHAAKLGTAAQARTDRPADATATDRWANSTTADDARFAGACPCADRPADRHRPARTRIPEGDSETHIPQAHRCQGRFETAANVRPHTGPNQPSAGCDIAGGRIYPWRPVPGPVRRRRTSRDPHRRWDVRDAARAAEDGR